MGTVPVTIDGVLLPKMRSTSDQPKAVVLTGQLNITGLSVGGGPIDPPPAGVPPTAPGAPTFPIWGPPGINLPPIPGYPPVAGHPLPVPPDPPVIFKPTIPPAQVTTVVVNKVEVDIPIAARHLYPTR